VNRAALRLIVLTLAFVPFPVLAQNDTAGIRIRDSLQAAPWLQFQMAIVRNDTGTVAGLVRYPLRVNGPGRTSRFIVDSEQFRREYGKILPPSYRALIKRLPGDSLWTSWRGTATPRGELWFEEACNRGSAAYCIPTRRLVTVNLGSR
jgi:hypothetical protein